MATLDELVVRIKADSSQLQQELRKVSQATKEHTGHMSEAVEGLKEQFAELVPALSVAAIVEFGRRAVEAAGHMEDMGQRIGFAASTLSALEPGLVKNSSNIDEFAATVNLMNANIGQAVSGNQQLVQAFDRLGLSVTKLKQLSPEEQFYAITRALAGLKTQYEQTETGRAIFGRGFATLIPLIKEAGGDLRDTVTELKAAGDALTDEKITRVKEFGDALSEAAITAKNQFLELFGWMLKVYDLIPGMSNVSESARKKSEAFYDSLPEPVRKDMEISQNGPTVVSGYTFDAKGNLTPPGGAAGSNADVLKNDAADRYKDAQGKLADYIEKLKQEQDIYSADEKQQAGLKAYYEILNQTKKDGLVISDAEKQKIEDLANATEEMKKKQEDARQTAREWQKELTDGLTDIILNFHGAKDAAKQFFDQIARQVLNKQITGPLAESITGAIGSSGGLFSGIGKLLGFAGGGDPPVGVPSIVGENGPEIFVPKTAGTIVPNGGFGGQSVSVTNVWQVQSGVTKQDLAALIPVIEARSKASVFQAIELGGREARLVNRKS